MNNKADQFVEAAAKLLALTQEGKLEWHPSPTIPGALLAYHRGQQLRMRKLPPEFYNEPPPISLEFLDDSGAVSWEFPQVEGLWDLFQAASYQASGVKNFLKGLLEE